jgi:hypothetical protein
MSAKYGTREEWLTAAVEYMNIHIFEPRGILLPELRLSVGWPGGSGPKSAVRGQCWTRKVSEDGVNQVFISPVVSDAHTVLAVLGHEVLHAVDDCKSGHRGNFAKMMKFCGYEGKMTTSEAGEALTSQLEDIARALGDYPHARLGGTPDDSAEGPKKQGTRMLKVSCVAESGYLVRMTRVWLDTYGAPICPCHNLDMIETA